MSGPATRTIARELALGLRDLLAVIILVPIGTVILLHRIIGGR